MAAIRRGTLRFVACAALLAALVQPLRASALDIPLVEIGAPGNPADANGYGSVPLAYSIAATEVTNAQYAAFLNAVAQTDAYGLYNTSMAADPWGGIVRDGSQGSYHYVPRFFFADRPVIFVGWYMAARFANWLQNGQPSGPQGPGTTESGSYDLSGAAPIQRGPQARWVIPSRDEWYKAAFHHAVCLDVACSDHGYSFFAVDAAVLDPDGSPAPAVPECDVTGAATNPGPTLVNYLGACNWNGSVSGNLMSVAQGAHSSWGAYDMSGNAEEWTDTWSALPGYEVEFPEVRGGSAGSQSPSKNLVSISNPVGAGNFSGFRVAFVPEPTAAACELGAAAAGVLLARRRTWRSPARVSEST